MLWHNVNGRQYDHNQLAHTEYGTEECLQRWKTEDIRVDDLPSVLLLRNIILVVYIVPCKIVPQDTRLKYINSTATLNL